MKNIQKAIIKRPEMSLWSRTSALWIWHITQFILSFILFKSIASFRLVFRALDIITNENVYKHFDVISLQLIIESLFILILFFYVVRNGVLLYGVALNVGRIRATDELLTSGGNSFGFEGEQGVGKTRSMVYSSMLLAASRSEDLCYKYYADLPIKDKLKQDGRLIELRKFRAREESFYFNFLESSNKIPTLHANVDINYSNSHPHKLTVQHFEMKQRLYENNVKILTEADDFFPNTLRKKKKAKKGEETEKEEDSVDINAVDKFVGLDRQYTNGTLISDTHANGDIFKGIRTCQSFTLYLTRAEIRYTPGILKKIERKLIKKLMRLGDSLFTPYIEDEEEETDFYKKYYADDNSFDDRMSLIYRYITTKTQKRIVKKLGKVRMRIKKVQKLMKKISITRIYYRKISGPGEFQTAEKEQFYVLPNQVPYVYDDRMFQQEYKFTPKA